MKDSLLNGILFFGAIQAMFFSLLFLAKKKKEIPDRIIAAWLFVLAINILAVFITKSIDNDYLKLLQVSFTLIHGPFLFLYAHKLTIENGKFLRTDFLHFIPFGMGVVAGLFALFNSIDIQKVILGIAYFGIISGVIYCGLVTYHLVEHNKVIRNRFSFTEKINLNWLTNLTIGLLIIWIGGSISGVLLRSFQFDISMEWLFAIVPLFVFYIGFYGIKQSIIYFPRAVVNKQNILSKAINIKQVDRYKKSGLQERSMKLIMEQLIHIMQSEKLYLNPILSLSDLVGHLNIPAHHITQTLNDYMNQSFYDFVNRYRVEEFKEKVIGDRNSKYSLLGIALDCGFNSKSSFNRIFKKHTGLTPSEFKQKKLS